MGLPFFSIVTISFNQSRYLRQCLDSVISQKSNDVEYIVVDPGSIDGSRQIIHSYGAAIDHFVEEPDQGPADGLNKGFSLGRGEVGYFINSDDFLLPGAISRMRKLWADTSSIDVLLGGAWKVDEDGKPIRELVAMPVSLDRLILERATIVQQGFSFRLAAFRKAGTFNIANRTCWDFELLCALIRNGASVRVVRDRIGAFRIHGESISGGAGGHALERRFVADRNRIHFELTGRRLDAFDPQPGIFDKFTRLVRRPQRALMLMRDRLFPNLMRQRWQSDVCRNSGEVQASL